MPGVVKNRPKSLLFEAKTADLTFLVSGVGVIF